MFVLGHTRRAVACTFVDNILALGEIFTFRSLKMPFATFSGSWYFFFSFTKNSEAKWNPNFLCHRWSPDQPQLGSKRARGETRFYI